MELNNYNSFSNHFKDNTRLDLKIKYEGKEANTMDTMEQIIQRKDAELIDHNLLPPEYIRDPNTFIIDLINFPKPINPPNNNSNNLTEDIHFHNTLFTETSNTPTDENCKAATVYMPLNSGFLIPVQKTFLPSVETAGENGTKVVQQLLLTDTNVTLDEGSVDEDCDISRFNSRTVLPHKKRIPRKLKIVQDEPELNLNIPLEQHKLLHVEELVGNNVQFRCELCGHTACTQLEFYVHLKQHYEPSTPNTLLSTMKISLEDVRPVKNTEANTLCNMNKKQTEGLDQVFQDVQFPFENFTQNTGVNNVDVVIEPHTHTEEQVDLKIVNKVLEEAMNATTTTLHHIQATSGQTQPTLVAEEFSDTEDMLEGIRDKVFIEDTCDAMDLMTPTPNGVRPHSFINSCFSGMELKTKPFCDVLFSGQFPPILQTDSNHNETLTTDNQIDSMKLTSKCLTRSTSPPPPQDLRLQLDRNEIMQSNDILLQNADKSCEPNHTIDIPLNTDTAFDVPKSHAHSIIIQEDELITHQVYREPSPDIPDSEPLPLENHSDDDFAEQLEDEPEEDGNDIYSNGRKRKRHICNKCQRVFNSRNALKYHHRTHTGFRPHQCDTCGKSFFAISALKAHVRTHTGDKPYDCAHCDQKFRQWSDLKYHFIAIHSNEKNHQCEFCGKAFSRKYSLVVHLRIHTGENNYKCEFCSKTFRASTYLQSHRKLHTGEKPYECDICSKKFRVSSDYSRHRRMHDRQKFK